ncbi:DNA repair protein RecO [Paenibacillus turpanensis]|uniref:DNA repair protein RecO n=1 Tax=Paenibacillus turpanensis TaxID=2689078 RepID=UPI001A9D32F5|nr:DNA repair protein RecO [Paenibacillus turpanensis]
MEVGEAVLYRVEGIVVRSMDYGEGNKIVTLYTKQTGKITVMARGARKLKSKFGALAQPLTHGEFVFFKTGSGSMGTLNHGEIDRSHSRLREDLTLAAYAAYIAELTDRLTEDGEANPFLFEQLKASLVSLEEGKDPQIVTHLFEWKVSAAAGYEPMLEACAACGADPSEGLAFSAAAGGWLCRIHRLQDPQSIPMDGSAFKLLRLLVALDARRMGSIAVKPESKLLMKQMVRLWFEHHIGIRFKSLHFLDQLEGLFDKKE